MGLHVPHKLSCSDFVKRLKVGKHTKARHRHSIDEGHEFGLDSEADEAALLRKPVKMVRDLGDSVISVSITPDGSLFAAGGVNKVAKVFSLWKPRKVREFVADAAINSVLLLTRQGVIKMAVGTFAGTIQIYDVFEERLECQLKFDKGAVLCMASALQGTAIAVGGTNGKVKLYSIKMAAKAEGGAMAEEGVAVDPPQERVKLTEVMVFHAKGNVNSVALDDGCRMLATVR